MRDFLQKSNEETRRQCARGVLPVGARRNFTMQCDRWQGKWLEWMS